MTLTNIVSPDGNPPWLNKFNQTALVSRFVTNDSLMLKVAQKAEYVNYIKTLTGYYKSIGSMYSLNWVAKRAHKVKKVTGLSWE